LKAREIRDHFVSQADWVDPEKTVDRIIVGDPDKEVHRALVTWISSFAAVRVAAQRGVDMLVTHEPTFWVHAHDLEHVADGRVERAKKAFLDDSGLVVLRIHDVWDRMPRVGIPWAWARFLDLGTEPAAVGANGYQHRYDIAPTTLDALGAHVAARTATLGEPWVQVVGHGAQQVSRVGIGTGCGCDIDAYQEMGCDVSVVCDDGSCYWSTIQRAADADHPVVRVNHGTSEEPGMVTLAEHINQHLPGVRAEHLPHGSSFRLVGAQA